MAEQRYILMVEDDPRLAESIGDFLTRRGYRVAAEPDGHRAVTRIAEEMPDLVLLDVMLPGESGLEICRQARRFYQGPILILTALSDDLDELAGLEAGADDYVRKTVRPRILLARIELLLRRKPATLAETAEERGIRVGLLEIALHQRNATYAGEPLDLTDAEYDLLASLARHRGTPMSREALYKSLRGLDYDGLDRSLDLRISRIRKKLRELAPEVELIKSIRGVGYMLVDER